jgi:hypothetical protein
MKFNPSIILSPPSKGEGINKYSQGEMYNILDIDFDGIKKQYLFLIKIKNLLQY